MNDKDIKDQLKNSKHFSDLTFSQSSVSKVTRKAYFQAVIRHVFIGLVTLFLLFFYMVTIHNVIITRYITEPVRVVLWIGLLVLFFFIAKKLDKWMQKLQYKFVIQFITSCLLVLYFAYQVFAPYLYTDNYLVNHGLEKIEQTYKVDDVDLSMEDREELAYDTYVRLTAFSELTRYKRPDMITLDTELIHFKVVRVERQYNQYRLFVDITEKRGEEFYTGEREFTFNKEMGTFKISGRQ